MRSVLALCALASLVSGCSGMQGDLLSPPEADLSPPEIATCRIVDIESQDISFSLTERDRDWDRYRLVAEFPQTRDEKFRGLQGRDPLPANTAMLFEFDGNHNPALWMKDTPASLDILFIDAEGNVFHGAYGTTPFSEAFITPEDPEPVTRWVLELPAGRARALGLIPGSAKVSPGATLPCRPGAPSA